MTIRRRVSPQSEEKRGRRTKCSSLGPLPSSPAKYFGFIPLILLEGSEHGPGGIRTRNLPAGELGALPVELRAQPTAFPHVKREGAGSAVGEPSPEPARGRSLKGPNRSLVGCPKGAIVPLIPLPPPPAGGPSPRAGLTPGPSGADGDVAPPRPVKPAKNKKQNRKMWGRFSFGNQDTRSGLSGCLKLHPPYTLILSTSALSRYS